MGRISAAPSSSKLSFTFMGIISSMADGPLAFSAGGGGGISVPPCKIAALIPGLCPRWAPIDSEFAVVRCYSRSPSRLHRLAALPFGCMLGHVWRTVDGLGSGARPKIFQNWLGSLVG